MSILENLSKKKINKYGKTYNLANKSKLQKRVFIIHLTQLAAIFLFIVFDMFGILFVVGIVSSRKQAFKLFIWTKNLSEIESCLSSLNISELFGSEGSITYTL